MQAEKKTRASTDPDLAFSEEKINKRLVLFDFDGTITTKDTLLEFLFFYKGMMKVGLGLLILSPVLLAYAFKLLPNWKAKQLLLKYFIGNTDAKLFNASCREFADGKLPDLVRPKAIDMIMKHLRDGDTVVVVSASPENWVAPWCDKLGVNYLATQLDVKDNKITGDICGKNCYGPEKVSRVKSQYSLSGFDEIIAYGDSSGDREMLAIAHHNFYKPFRD
jgi:phosphatidylglycerophosphatase C